MLFMRIPSEWKLISVIAPSHSSSAITPLLEKTAGGARLSDGDALRLFESADLLALGRAAHLARLRHHPEPLVTVVIDRNINYTNVCVGDCAFCAFHRVPGDPAAYVLSPGELRRKVTETYAAGGRQIMMQGGLHPGLPFSFYEQMLAGLKREFPDLHIHAFSPPEIDFFARLYALPVEEVITRLRAAGLDSIPGGGAEILVDRVRKKVSPAKLSADGWIGVMRTAHRLGLRTTATMMFGLIETAAERVEHLRRLRELQDETGGFTAFACWTFQPRNAANKDKFAGAFEYLKTTAIARLYLDNFANIQASWVTQGDKIAQLSLAMGVNDLGSLMLEENVVAAAGTHFEYSLDHLRRLAQEMGYELRLRDYYYKIFQNGFKPDVP